MPLQSRVARSQRASRAYAATARRQGISNGRLYRPAGGRAPSQIVACCAPAPCRALGVPLVTLGFPRHGTKRDKSGLGRDHGFRAHPAVPGTWSDASTRSAGRGNIPPQSAAFRPAVVGPEPLIYRAGHFLPPCHVWKAECHEWHPEGPGKAPEHSKRRILTWRASPAGRYRRPLLMPCRRSCCCVSPLALWLRATLD